MRLSPALEVAMGLETAHPRRARASEQEDDGRRVRRSPPDALQSLGVALRVFLLVSPPFVPPAEQDDWLLRSIEWRLAAGASAIALIPTRHGKRRARRRRCRRMLSASRRWPTSSAAWRSRMQQPPAAARASSLISGISSDSPPARTVSMRVARRLRRDESRSARQPQPSAARSARHCSTVMTHSSTSTSPSSGPDSRAPCARSRCGSEAAGRPLERGRHPRFAIGESTTPLTNLLHRRARRSLRPAAVRSFSKWGTWQRAHANVGCGLKRGFTFPLSSPRRAHSQTTRVMPGNCWSPPVRNDRRRRYALVSA